MAVGAGPQQCRLSGAINQKGENSFALPALYFLAFHALLHGIMDYGLDKIWKVRQGRYLQKRRALPQPASVVYTLLWP